MGHFSDLNGVFAWGERQKQMIESDRFSFNTKIYVTGSPLFKKEHHNKEMTGYDKKQILYAASRDDNKEIAVLLKTLKNIQISTELSLKVHPGVSDMPYHKFCKNTDVKLILATEVLEDYLKSSHLLLTTGSVASLQAMCADIPTLYIGIEKHVINFVKMYFKFNDEEFSCLVAKDYVDVKSKIEKLLTSKTYLEEHIKIQRNYLGKIVYLDSNPDYPIKMISSIINN